MLTVWLSDHWLTAAFCRGIFFFVVAVAYSQWWDIFSVAAKSIFITELNNGIITRQVYFNNDLGVWVLHGNSSYSVLEYGILNSDISQGSVATLVRCGGIFNVDFIANLPSSLPVKELWKSVSIWRSYWPKCGFPFFGPPCIFPHPRRPITASFP